MSHWLAQIKIGRLLAPPGDPRVADFVNALDEINALAERSPGFVWRLKSDTGNALDIRYSDDPLEALNMSVWESVESVLNYAYASEHVAFLKRRAEWFEKHTQPHYCLWWVPAGHVPTVSEGIERLEHYRKYGATEHAFWFSQRFPAPELVTG